MNAQTVASVGVLSAVRRPVCIHYCVSAEMDYNRPTAAIFNDLSNVAGFILMSTKRTASLPNHIEFRESCPRVGLTHGLDWIGLGWVEIFSVFGELGWVNCSRST